MEIMNYNITVSLTGLVALFVAIVFVFKGIPYIKERMNGGKFSASSLLPGSKATPMVIDTTAMGNDELVAVITAAVMTMLEKEAEEKGGKKGEKPAFVVRSIRRVSNAPAWNRAGREEQVYSRM